jgi:hypothetical protein
MPFYCHTAYLVLVISHVFILPLISLMEHIPFAWFFKMLLVFACWEFEYNLSSGESLSISLLKSLEFHRYADFPSYLRCWLLTLSNILSVSTPCSSLTGNAHVREKTAFSKFSLTLKYVFL